MSTILIIGTFQSSVVTLIRLLEYEQNLYVTNVRFCCAASCLGKHVSILPKKRRFNNHKGVKTSV